jgi:hypothetical protein
LDSTAPDGPDCSPESPSPPPRLRSARKLIELVAASEDLLLLAVMTLIRGHSGWRCADAHRCTKPRSAPPRPELRWDAAAPDIHYQCRCRYLPRTVVGSRVMSQLHTWSGRLARCRLLARVTCAIYISWLWAAVLSAVVSDKAWIRWPDMALRRQAAGTAVDAVHAVHRHCRGFNC